MYVCSVWMANLIWSIVRCTSRQNTRSNDACDSNVCFYRINLYDSSVRVNVECYAVCIQTHTPITNAKRIRWLLLVFQLKAVLNRETSGKLRGHTSLWEWSYHLFLNITRLIESTLITPMADSMEKVQDQPQQLKQKHQINQNHSDGVNGESTPDSVIQPKQTIGKWKTKQQQQKIHNSAAN